MADTLVREIWNPESETWERQFFTQAPTRPPKPRDKNFMRSRPQADLDLAQMKLNGPDFRVFHYLRANCEWHNRVVITQAKMRQATKLSRATIWRALRALQNAGILIVDRDEPTRGWLHPEHCWKGHTDALSKAIADFDAVRKNQLMIDFALVMPDAATEEE